MNKQLSNKYLNEYTTRFTRTQKIDFAKSITQDFESLGCKTHIQDLKLKTSKVQNILIGNFKIAKTILVVPYDTQSRIFYPNYKYYPQNGLKSMSSNFLPIYGPMIFLYLLLLAIIYGLPMIMENTTIIVSAITLFYFVLLLIFIWRGFSNKNNVSANNLSTVMALDLMESLPMNKRQELAIVFTDKNNPKMVGSKVLLKYMETINKNTNMILLYCLGQGDSISIAYQKSMKKQAQQLSKICDYKHQLKAIDKEESIQLPIHELSNALMISSGTIKDGLLSVKNIRTHKDTDYQQEVYDKVKEMLIQHLQ